MLDIIKSHLNQDMSREEKIHLVREDLQLIILKILYDTGMFRHLAFVGGTALRILFDLRRFSEDLDFNLIRKKGYSFSRFSRAIEYQLEKYALSVDVKKDDLRTVQRMMLRFKNILISLGLSEMREQKLSIGLEIDARPPEGWNTDISLISKFFVFTVTHYDIRSLYATKLHACFFRKYVKGRDFYDLVWYLGKKISPNFPLLNNAIAQTENKKVVITEKNFKEFLMEKMAKVDFVKVRKDVERFLVDKRELSLLNKELIKQLLSG